VVKSFVLPAAQIWPALVQPRVCGAFAAPDRDQIPRWLIAAVLEGAAEVFQLLSAPTGWSFPLRDR
jgi:hypothetical protein